jgi:beta-fructofuranosidase
VDEELREKLRADPHRPRYHFLPPANWLNDPNGLIQWRGRYHLFYQYNPKGPFHGAIHWGHAASHDLVHWEHLPIALAPTRGEPDEDGCWSGCAVNDNGVPTLIYTGLRALRQLPCVATGDDDLVHWRKDPDNPVIVGPPPDLPILEEVNFRDHSVWKEGDTWYQVIGSGITGVGGAALLYRSPDLRHWDYLHPLLVGDMGKTDPLWTGEMWECPDFFALGDKHVLVVSIWDNHQLHYPAYAIGTYADRRFTPERYGVTDFGRSFYAPQSMTDDRGRRLMWGWLREGRGAGAQIEAGWSGVMSLPRVLSLRPDGLLGMAPAPELALLRGRQYEQASIELTPAASPMPFEPGGLALEIEAEWDCGDAEALGFSVRASPDGAEQTRIFYDRAQQRLLLDRSRSSLAADVSSDERGGHFELGEGETLQLRIFLDGSALEVFANGRACLCERIYPTRPDSLGLAAFAQGGTATLKSLRVWEMDGIWEGAEQA